MKKISEIFSSAVANGNDCLAGECIEYVQDVGNMSSRQTFEYLKRDNNDLTMSNFIDIVDTINKRS